MKAIETKYDGYRFRSRLEARWAVFFNSLGLKYEYEKEGFETSLGYYLPDFYLPKPNYFIEIKGISPNDSEVKKLSEVVKLTLTEGFILTGIPTVRDIHEGEIDQTRVFEDGGEDNNHYFCQCKYCDEISIQFDGRGNRIDCGCEFQGEHMDLPGGERHKYYSFGTDLICESLKRARVARFEHGESPSTDMVRV